MVISRDVPVSPSQDRTALLDGTLDWGSMCVPWPRPRVNHNQSSARACIKTAMGTRNCCRWHRFDGGKHRDTRGVQERSGP